MAQEVVLDEARVCCSAGGYVGSARWADRSLLVV
jgi:hypothetical protein